MKILNDIRRALDARAQDIAALGRSRETSLALTTCQQARMLLGDTLKLLGGSTPYPASDDPTSPVVAPAADTVGDYAVKLPADGIAAVKEVRRRIATVSESLGAAHAEVFKREIDSEGRPVVTRTAAETVYERAVVELVLARNWLGMELARIADANAKGEAVPAAKDPRI